MGADNFEQLAIGRFENARDALRSAVDEAQYNHGHGGYTGTIAEKHKCEPYNFKSLDEQRKAERNPMRWLDNNPEAMEQDKWGPAFYIEVTNKALLKRLKERHGLKNRKSIRAFLFFGVAPC